MLSLYSCRTHSQYLYDLSFFLHNFYEETFFILVRDLNAFLPVWLTGGLIVVTPCLSPAGQWVRGWFKEVAVSTYKPGRYDLPADSAEWLNQFRVQNQGKLTELKVIEEWVFMPGL